MRTNRRFALLIGALLLIEGIWGLSSPVVFGHLTTNHTHAIIHIILGVGGICAGASRSASLYATFLGLLLLTVGALWFAPQTKEILVQMLNVNKAVACVNIAIGVVSLLVGIGTRSDVIKTR